MRALALIPALVALFAGPASAQIACTPLEAFIVQQVEPVQRAGIPVLTITNAWEVGRYLEVVNRQPPETNVTAEALIIGVAANMAVVALVERGHVCAVFQLQISVHNDALLAAKRGA
jgi:hypothetical protein